MHNRAKGRLFVAVGSVYRRVMAAALLLADAEPETRGFLERHLPGDGFELVPAHGRFDLVLAGDVEGVDRWLPRAPVIVLGREEADTVDCIHAFRRGCDDYVTRPFEYQELVERIRAVLRRAAPRTGEVVEAPPVRIDTRTRDVRVAGRRMQLAQKEYELLLCLAREPERVFTKAELLHDVWGYRTIGRTRTLDSHASRLRRKLREAGSSASLIENVWGVGYRLVGELPLE
jgi:DNA-binding response OmpR family regulator